MSDKIVADVLDGSYPLLTILREKCPGTYAHSKNVVMLLESLAIELKLNTKMLKIAGQYHDIGKTINPKYFVENLVDGEDNPHDKLEPHISHKIITAHIGNTAQILINDENISVEVIRWCIQYHGNSILKPFYNKSKKKSKDNYRYHCTAPNSLEAGLLMLCDCLEAKCKALYQKENPPEIKEIVSDTFEELMEETQLDNIELPKLSYIRIIKQILTRELNSMYQSKRIDYKEED